MTQRYTAAGVRNRIDNLVRVMRELGILSADEVIYVEDMERLDGSVVHGWRIYKGVQGTDDYNEIMGFTDHGGHIGMSHKEAALRLEHVYMTLMYVRDEQRRMRGL